MVLERKREEWSPLERKANAWPESNEREGEGRGEADEETGTREEATMAVGREGSVDSDNSGEGPSADGPAGKSRSISSAWSCLEESPSDAYEEFELRDRSETGRPWTSMGRALGEETPSPCSVAEISCGFGGGLSGKSKPGSSS